MLMTVFFSVVTAAYAGLEGVDNGTAIAINENGRPVLVYNYQPVTPPEGVAGGFTRACYIHPLYGPDGEIMTQDFPSDHRHHRGVFWAWPECTAGDRKMDVWALTGVRQRTQDVKFAMEDGNAVVRTVNIWSFDDSPEEAVIKEDVVISVHPGADNARTIDFDLKFTNMSQGDVTFLGAAGKGYGGLCYRPDAKRFPFTFKSAQGLSPEDVLRLDTPWADISFANGKGGTSGVAVFQSKENPGYPFPGWIFRHYGFLGASWPHEQTHKLAPTESFNLKYRMYIHGGGADEAKVAEQFKTYSK